MASTTFSSGTVIASTWLNAVNTAVYNTLPTLAPLINPNFTTPSLGVATATSINKVNFTPVATSATWTLANNKQFTVNNTVTISGTDGAVLTLGAGTTSVSGTSSGVNTGDQTLFKYISVFGQPQITASSSVETLNFVAGTGITLTTDNTAKAVTLGLSASASAMVLLASFSVSSATASLDFLNIFSASYDNYIIHINNLSVSATSALSLRVAIGTGTVDSTSVYNGCGADNTVPGTATAASITAASMTSSGFGSGTIFIRNVNSTTTNTIKSIGSYGYYGSTVTLREGAYRLANVLTGFQLFPTSGGNFTSGTVSVYGIRNS